MATINEPIWQEKTKKKVAKQTLILACASTQSDQSLLYAQRVTKDPNFRNADSIDSDQTELMPWLI